MTPHDYPDFAPLLAAVAACVEDDTARAALTDWLDERGFSRHAEAVRRLAGHRWGLMAGGGTGQVPEAEWRLVDPADYESGPSHLMFAWVRFYADRREAVRYMWHAYDGTVSVSPDNAYGHTSRLPTAQAAAIMRLVEYPDWADARRTG